MFMRVCGCMRVCVCVRVYAYVCVCVLVHAVYVCACILSYVCACPLLLRKAVDFTLTVSSTLDSQHSEDQLSYGDILVTGKAGYWRPSTSDANPSIEVYILII